MASEPVLCLLTTFSHLAANSLRDALPCFTSLLSFVDNTLYHFDDLVVMTQHVTAQTVSKIMCRLPNKARLPTHSPVFTSFLTVIFGPSSFSGVSTATKMTKKHQKDHATPTAFSFRIKLPALRLTKRKKCNTACPMLCDECNL